MNGKILKIVTNPATSCGLGILAYGVILMGQLGNAGTYARLNIEAPFWFAVYTALPEELVFVLLFVILVLLRKTPGPRALFVYLFLYKWTFVFVETLVYYFQAPGSGPGTLVQGLLTRMSLHVMLVSGAVLLNGQAGGKPTLKAIVVFGNFIFALVAHSLYNYAISRYTVTLAIPYALIASYWALALLFTGILFSSTYGREISGSAGRVEPAG